MFKNLMYILVMLALFQLFSAIVGYRTDGCAVSDIKMETVNYSGRGGSGTYYVRTALYTCFDERGTFRTSYPHHDATITTNFIWLAVISVFLTSYLAGKTTLLMVPFRRLLSYDGESDTRRSYHTTGKATPEGHTTGKTTLTGPVRSTVEVAFGGSTRLTWATTWVTGNVLLRAIRDDVGPGIKMTYQEAGASSFGTAVAIAATAGEETYTLSGVIRVKVNNKRFYAFIKSTGIVNGEFIDSLIYVV